MAHFSWVGKAESHESTGRQWLYAGALDEPEKDLPG